MPYVFTCSKFDVMIEYLAKTSYTMVLIQQASYQASRPQAICNQYPVLLIELEESKLIVSFHLRLFQRSWLRHVYTISDGEVRCVVCGVRISWVSQLRDRFVRIEYVLRFGATRSIRNGTLKKGFEKLVHFLLRMGGSVCGVEKVRMSVSSTSSLTSMYTPWVKIV